MEAISKILFGSAKGGTGFSDFFLEAFFGNFGGSPSGAFGTGGDEFLRGQVVETEIEISLEEALRGTSRIIRLDNEKIKG